MFTLFVDTHGSLITVGLYNEEKEFIKTQISEYKHAIYLMPMIKEILKENVLSVKDIKDIVIVNGPGSFTGLRIGLSACKTMAYALNIPIYLISSLTSFLISSEIKNKRIAIIKDNKGFYISVMGKDNKIIVPEQYVNELGEYSKIKKVEEKLNISRIINYAKKSEAVNPHLVRANYVKLIEAEK